MTIRLSIRRNQFLLRILLSCIATGSILLGALSFVLYGQYSRSFIQKRLRDELYNRTKDTLNIKLNFNWVTADR